MKVDISVATDPRATGENARQAEADGYDGVWMGETTHDPLLGCALAGQSTSHIDVGTGIAVAFARSPMTLAVTANDLQLLTGGRFLLGLGSQVRAHITRRFSMPWSHPAPRMREFILAMRAIWRSWQAGEPLNFTGEFYSHTLMTPFFNPGPNPYGPPRVFLAGVGDVMTRVAGEVADGFLCHGFTTERYLRSVTLPALAEGRRTAGASMDGYEISGLPFVVTGTSEAEMEQSALAVREQIAFYASTPAYRPVLEAHGWADLQAELTLMSRAGRWQEMRDLVDDDILNAFAIVAEPGGVAEGIRKRYGGIFTRLHLYLKTPLPRDAELSIVAALRPPG
ncbi:MAG: TIGR03617 family F420-dependent LLM class oxidoreductase [Streptosporangiaceae bacterium]|nr:TIGR03617 family F420-dependent LLM class oxidoreductase [Streptosporangiaceae bacterium]MBV9855409.1 TIGR03617 family F420-dependent LLM class oxidoreductase [Streptosporangiaceae bacterium]